MPALRGHGLGHRLRPDRALRRRPSRSPRARSPSPATAWTAGTAGIFSGAGLAMDKPIAQVHQEGAADAALRGADQDQGRGRQPHLRGRDPEDPEVDALQGRRGDAAARPRASSSGRSPSRPAPTATAPGSARRRCRRRSAGKNIAELCAMQISDLADVGARRSTSRRSRRCSPGCSTCSTPSPRSGSATSRSTGRPARCPAARRSAPR